MRIRISYDLGDFELDRIVNFIQNSYWGSGRMPEAVQRSLENSSVVGLFEGGQQLGMARAVSDHVFHAYVFDLFVFEEHRGRGLSRMLIEALLDHPDLAGVSGWMLSTKDAHGLYRKYGFQPTNPERTMWMKRS